MGATSGSFGGRNLGALGFIIAAPIAVAGVLPPVLYVTYSVVGSGSAAVSHTVRTVAIDFPKAVGHRLRTHQGQIQQDIRRLVLVWTGPARRPNRWLAIRGSRGSIIAHAQRLERTTGQRLGANPADWIKYYEKEYGEWKWERP